MLLASIVWDDGEAAAAEMQYKNRFSLFSQSNQSLLHSFISTIIRVFRIKSIFQPEGDNSSTEVPGSDSVVQDLDRNFNKQPMCCWAQLP